MDTHSVERENWLPTRCLAICGRCRKWTQVDSRVLSSCTYVARDSGVEGVSKGQANVRTHPPKLPSGLYQAGYTGPDLATHYAEHTFTAKIDAEAWLAAERALVEKHGWMPPKARRVYEEANRPPTVDEYAEGWRQLPRSETANQGALRGSAREAHQPR